MDVVNPGKTKIVSLLECWSMVKQTASTKSTFNLLLSLLSQIQHLRYLYQEPRGGYHLHSTECHMHAIHVVNRRQNATVASRNANAALS